MLWNDDFHHTACVRLTGKREAYCTDYLGSPQEFISSIKYGFLYQGQYYSWQEKGRGVSDFSLRPESIVTYLENHDQIANMGGKRLYQKADYGNYKAMLALFLLGPNTPLIFQGQEFNSKQPFHFFSEHSPKLVPIVSKGRKEELAQFPSLATAEARKKIPNPEDPNTFIQCKLNPKDLESGYEINLLFTHLIKLRQYDTVLKKMQRLRIDGAVLGNDCFLIRYFGKSEDRILIVNFGSDFHFDPSPEPLLAPRKNGQITVCWSSESVEYGGSGTPPINIPYWKFIGHSAILIRAI